MAVSWNKLLISKIAYNLNIYRHFCKTICPEENLKENPYYEKYANKIQEVQNTSPEEFRGVLQEKLKSTESETLSSLKQPEKLEAESKSKVPQLQGKKGLDQIMKIETVQEKSASEIEKIWKDYHKHKDGVYAVLPAEAYENLYTRLKKYPTFLYPLPRAQGYEFILQQFLDHSCYFTSLINYQAHKENALVCLTITYFRELVNDKGIVLMRGEYDHDTLNAMEVQCLTSQLQLYYGGKDKEKERLLQIFNKQPELFKHMDLISNFESSLGS